MQQFFLLCTMLIVASEAFSKEIHRNQVSASVKRKFSRFVPKLRYSNSDRFMLDGLNLPMFLVPSSYGNPDKEASFVSPLRRRDFKHKPFRRNSFLYKKRNFSSRQRFRDKFLKKGKRNSPWPFDVANSYVINSPLCFEKQLLPGSDVPFEHHRHLNSVFGDVFDSRRSVNIRSPNQYIVCVYPVFNNKKFRLKKRTLGILKKLGFSALKKKYLLNHNSKPNKNKRSTNSTTTTEETASEEKKQLVTTTTTQKYLENPVSPKQISQFPHGIDYPYDSFDSQTPNSFLTPLPNRQPSLYKFSPLPYSDFSPSYLGVTQPSFSLPKINFKYPYDPEVYETSLRSDSSLFPTLKKKELSELEGKLEGGPQPSSSPDLAKLKTMLDEVEEVLKDEKDKSTFKDHTAKHVKEKTTVFDRKKKKLKLKYKGEVSQESLKQKIDDIVIPILSQISQALGKLSRTPFVAEKVNSTKNITTSRCSADGTWMSSVLGMEMTFTTLPNMMLDVKITNKKDSVINSKWSIHGLTLSKQGGPLMLAAIYPQKRQIASFIGQCKMCRNQDLIFGTWTIYTCMRKFSDLWRAVDIKLDILRKQRGPA